MAHVRTKSHKEQPGCRLTIAAEGCLQTRMLSPGQKLKIGRAAACRDDRDILCLSDDTVSTEHAELWWEGTQVFIADRGSRNGTYVNGELARGNVRLEGECALRLGRVCLIFKYVTDASKLAEQIPDQAWIEQQPEFQIEGRTVVACDPRSKDVYRTVALYAQSSETVLITGSTGVGKESVARLLHCWSPRQHMGKLVAFDAAAIPSELAESELFGHVKGAFTDATAAKVGLMQEAHHGTLFIDEIGNMPLPLQEKLLRALAEKEIRPVGSTKPIPIDVRLVAATSADVHDLLDRKLLREDLYYRLYVLPIHIPPLRERPRDIPYLVDLFLRDNSTGPPTKFSDRALQLLVGYSWPGNLRQLKNVLARLRVGARGEMIDDQATAAALSMEHQPGRSSSESASVRLLSPRERAREAEAQYLRAACQADVTLEEMGDHLGCTKENVRQKLVTLKLSTLRSRKRQLETEARESSSLASAVKIS